MRAGMAPRLAVTLGQYTCAGRKDENQDFHGALQPDGAPLATKGIAVAIADGISTSSLGAVAAETAVKSFLTDYYCTSEGWSVRTSAERVIAATNSWLHGQNRRAVGRTPDEHERERGLVCTFSALVLKARTAYVLHVGDARIALLREGMLEPLTEAHRVYVGGGESYLGRALGVNRYVEIDFRQLAVEPGDLFIMSTDGVHEHLADDQLVALASGDGDLDARAEAIAGAASAAGSGDNLTVQLVLVESLPRAEIEDLVGGDASLPPAPQLRAGETFAGYHVLRELHSGSRSQVYLARDETDGRLVAIKVPSTEHGENIAQLQALQLEEWVMRRLDSPHLLSAAPAHGARRHAFVAMEYVEGQTLLEWIHDHPQPDLAQVRRIVRQVSIGLLAMHRREMVHRDLRPHNILIDGSGTVKIIDFGSTQVAGIDELAPKPEEDSAYAGTMQYSAPELYLGEPATPQSDLFSLAVIAYQMLTGDLPYGPRVSATRTRAAQRRLRYVPASERNPEVPSWMDAALARALAVEPARRYSELSEFTFDLANPNRALASPEPSPLLQRGSARDWRVIAALLALALVIAVVTRPDLPL